MTIALSVKPPEMNVCCLSMRFAVEWAEIILPRGMREFLWARVASGEFRPRRGRKALILAVGSQPRKRSKLKERLGSKGVIGSQGRGSQIMPSSTRRFLLTEAHSHLNRAQRRAAEEECSHRRIEYRDCREARGVGKTTLLYVVREGAEKNGVQRRGVRPDILARRGNSVTPVLPPTRCRAS